MGRPMGNSRKILIIDDDDELRDSLSEQLSLHEEFDTMLAANASDGLKLARNGHVDIVLLDVGLPDSPRPSLLSNDRSLVVYWTCSNRSCTSKEDLVK